MWIADAKAYDDLGNIDRSQIFGFILEASRTTMKLLILYVPSKADAIIPDDVAKAAKKAGVEIKLVEVPFQPELDPNYRKPAPAPKPVPKTDPKAEKPPAKPA